MQQTEYSPSDRALGRAILRLDAAGVSAALESGATAHKAPFRQISWALLPVCVSLQQRAAEEAVTEDVQTMVRTLIREGAPTTGLSHLVGAGVRFSRGDMSFFLDNWLWRDADEVKRVVQLLGDDEEAVRALIETGHVPLDLLMPSGQTILQYALVRDMASAVDALCGLGADPNVKVTHSLGEVPAIEAAVHDGRLRTAMALLASGAFYDGARLAQLASTHSLEAVQAITDCVGAFETDQARSVSDLVARPSFAAFVEVHAQRVRAEAVQGFEASRASMIAGAVEKPSFDAFSAPAKVGTLQDLAAAAGAADAQASADPFLSGFEDIIGKP